MLHMELPQINVLSKIDLTENYGKLGLIMTLNLPHFVSSIIYQNENNQRPVLFSCQLLLMDLLQLLILIARQMCKIYRIHNTVLIKTLILLSTGLIYNGLMTQIILIGLFKYLS